MINSERPYRVHLSAIFIISIISVIACYKIIFTEGLILYGDFTFPTSIQRFFDMHYPLWNQYGSTNSFQFISRLAVRGIPLILGNFLGISAGLFYKLMVLSTMILSGLSMYFAFFYLITPSRSSIKKISTVALIISLIYMFNFKAIQTISWPILYFGYAIAPITLVCFIKLVSTSNVRYAMIVAFLMTLMAGSPHYLVFIALLMVSWLVYYAIIHKFKNLQKSMELIFICLIMFLLTSLFWILPYVYASICGSSPAPEYVVTSETVDMLSRNSETINTFRLTDIWWQHTSLTPENKALQNIWTFSSFIVPILGFSSLLVSKRKYWKYSMFFSLISVILVFLSTGTNNNLSFIYSWIISELPFSWLFRTPNKLTMILAMMYSFLCGITLMYIYENNWIKKIATYSILIVLFGLSVSFMASGYLYGIFTPVQIPEEYYDVNNFISGYQGEYKVLWLPLDYSKGTNWASGKLVGPIDILSSSIPTIAAFNINSKNYLNYVFDTLIENKSYAINKSINFLNVRYIIFHDDVGSYEKYNIKEKLLTQSGIVLQENNNFIYAFENPAYTKHASIPVQNIGILGGLNKFTSINNIEHFEPSISAIFFYDQFDYDEYIRYFNIVILDNPPIFSFFNNRYLIKPFDSTNHHDPKRMWSKASTANPLHGDILPYFERFGIENRDFDYGKGLVLTWTNSIIGPTVNLNDKDLWQRYDFESSLDGWDVNAKDIQTISQNDEAHSGKKSIQSTLIDSKRGWKVISSPFIPATYSIPYGWKFYVKGENAHVVHAKMVEYDKDKKFLTAKQVLSIGSETFDWKDVTFDYKPEDKRTQYIQFQIWHGHETTQPLPNKIWLDDVRVYDLTKYLEPVTLDMDVNIEKDGAYELFVRYFRNKDGGAIDIAMDGQSVQKINTYDQLNKFVWKKVNTLDLKKGKHKLTLTNLEGFNAVNIFALIPSDEYADMEKKTEELLEGKRLMYVFEGESDLYRTGANTSKKYGGEASNGEVLELNRNSTIWQTVSIMRSGLYRMALKIKGDLNVKIDDNSYKASSNNTDYAYIGPLYFEKGDHNMEITQRNGEVSDLDVVWLYSTDNENETLDDIFIVNETPATVNEYNKHDPTLYNIKVNAKKPFMLSFAESYDPLWYAEVTKRNGIETKSEKVRPVPLYSVINGFWINQTGDLEIKIEYGPQKWFYVGAAISLTALLLCVIYLVYDWRRGRRKKKETTETGKKKQ